MGASGGAQRWHCRNSSVALQARWPGALFNPHTGARCSVRTGHTMHTPRAHWKLTPPRPPGTLPHCSSGLARPAEPPAGPKSARKARRHPLDTRLPAAPSPAGSDSERAPLLLPPRRGPVASCASPTPRREARPGDAAACCTPQFAEVAGQHASSRARPPPAPRPAVCPHCQCQRAGLRVLLLARLPIAAASAPLCRHSQGVRALARPR